MNFSLLEFSSNSSFLIFIELDFGKIRANSLFYILRFSWYSSCMIWITSSSWFSWSSDNFYYSVLFYFYCTCSIKGSFFYSCCCYSACGSCSSSVFSTFTFCLSRVFDYKFLSEFFILSFSFCLVLYLNWIFNCWVLELTLSFSGEGSSTFVFIYSFLGSCFWLSSNFIFILSYGCVFFY